VKGWAARDRTEQQEVVLDCPGLHQFDPGVIPVGIVFQKNVVAFCLLLFESRKTNKNKTKTNKIVVRIKKKKVSFSINE
jgi:hypothetical protein